MLENKVIAISGGVGKIGLSFTKCVLENNGKILIGDRKVRQNLQILKKYKKENIVIYSGDLTKEKNIKEFLSLGLKKFKKIDSVVHCAYPVTANWGKKFEDLKLKDLGVNLTSQLGGAIIFSKIFMKYFVKKKKGNLIHIASIQGFRSPKFDHYKGTNIVSPIEYSAIKSGIISITSYLAKYYKGKNIRVNCISPGGILDNQPKNFLMRYNNDCNLKGMLNSDDLNGAFLFLLSENSKFINGQNIIVDDGWSL